jgi:outer membrane protein TolC
MLCRTFSLSLLLACSCAAETVDLPMVLRLAGAQAMEVQLAQAKLDEARGLEQQRVLAFLPTVNVGLGYKAHHGQLQDVVGAVIRTDKQSLTLGPAATLDLPLGEAIYRRLAAKQSTLAAASQVEAQRLSTQAQAAVAYFDLVQAQALLGVAQESVRISVDYGKQVASAVAAGVAFKGDALRVEVQTQRNKLVEERATQALRQASIHLAQVLRLDPNVALQAVQAEPQLLKLASTQANAGALAERAEQQRPERAQLVASLAAAQAERDAAVKGPWIPSVTAQAFAGGLSGGVIGGTRSGTAGSQDYFIGLSWRIGVGGLMDKGRQKVAEAKLRQTELEQEQLREAIRAQVLSLHARCESLAAQVATARLAVAAAQENSRLTHERQDLAVGVVLESILAEQELTQARTDYLRAVTEHNASQYLLLKAVGE